jgi:GT2 family glycosyltransferase/glycosyltransferase involved in cell wall biosynthesis
MPFDRDGKWVAPGDRDIQAFKGTLGSEPQSHEAIQPTPELIAALQSVATPDVEESSTPIDFFNTIARIKGAVDIVIPVYGGLHVLRDCVDSVQARTHWDYKLIFIDDCSPDPEVLNYIYEVQAKDPERITVLRNKQNRGFASSVNRGVTAGSSPYLCILNTDVIVTDGWLARMLVALESDERNCLVNPATNNTALINVDMYDGRSYLDMDLALTRQSVVRYPEIMPTGFCFMYRRALIEEIGPFDEAYGSYGEETDFWFRAINHVTDEGVLLGYKAVMADNVYLFHERGTSFSQLGADDHMQQRKSGSARFHSMHPGFAEWSKGYSVDNAIGGLRRSIPPKAFTREPVGNVAWAVKTTGACGGMYYIADIANRMIELGYNVKICLIPDDPLDDEGNQATQAVLGSLRTRPIQFNTREEFVSQFNDRVFSGPGILFSAVTELSPACALVAQGNPDIKVLNHVQSWDIDLAKELGRDDVIPLIEKCYTEIPNIVSSKWVAAEIKKLGGEVVATIPPGVNPDLFHDRDRSENGDERITFGIIMLKDNPFKGYDRGVTFCNAMVAEARNKGIDIRLLAIGTDVVPEARGVIGLGGLSQAKMGDLLGRELDVLIDPATVHSYGLPGVEALFSGASFLCWENKGVHDYKDDFDQLANIRVLPNDSEPQDWVDAAFAAVDQVNGRALDRTDLPEEHVREESVELFINAVCVGAPKPVGHRVEVISPHMRKHGGPTTLINSANLLRARGNDVSLSMCYSDWNPEVVGTALCPVRRTGWDFVPDGVEVCIINSDNPFAKQIMNDNPDPKYVMYKLSHNERFKQIENDNLNLDWAHIMTSTEHLRQACLGPLKDWDHKPWDPAKVTTIGWYHYGHEMFNMPPNKRTYGSVEVGFRLGTLVHGHPLKGTQECMNIIDALKKKYEANFHAAGFGEVRTKLPWYMQYFANLSRQELASAFQQFDVVLGGSHTEGLGRISLEAMSAGAVVITTNTGAEFLKDGENCLLYEPGDQQRGGDLVDMVMQDADLFKTLVTGGYKTACDHADPRDLSLNLNKVIEDVVNGL